MTLELASEPRKTMSTGAAVLLSIGSLALGWLIATEDPMTIDRPTIGADEVPADLDCEEDEVIGYDPTRWQTPRPLTCVHPDKFDR